MDILDLIFPKKCLECGKGGKYICEDCLGKVPKLGWHGSDTFSIWRYQGVIRKAILNLKYKYSTEIAKEIASLSVGGLKDKNFNTKNTLLIPIPLHWKRENLRGFNQSVEMGKLIAREMNWEFIPNLLMKKKQTKSQVELRGKERRANLQNAFGASNILKSSALTGKTIIVFDDVYTTGSTMKEAMQTIKQKDVEKVLGLTIAR